MHRFAAIPIAFTICCGMNARLARSGVVQPGVRNCPCHRFRLRQYAVIAAVAVALQVLAAIPLRAVAAMATVGSQAVGDGWISHIDWKSRQLTPGVTVRSGIVSGRAVAERMTIPKICGNLERGASKGCARKAGLASGDPGYEFPRD